MTVEVDARATFVKYKSTQCGLSYEIIEYNSGKESRWKRVRWEVGFPDGVVHLGSLDEIEKFLLTGLPCPSTFDFDSKHIFSGSLLEIFGGRNYQIIEHGERV